MAVIERLVGLREVSGLMLECQGCRLRLTLPLPAADGFPLDSLAGCPTCGAEWGPPVQEIYRDLVQIASAAGAGGAIGLPVSVRLVVAED